ncbi:MAG: tripartite tricarboxylate transporter TctB family protein [Alphaproteobacteria bacterium]|nr:tripartite tricarboxylate transporter TctB family protein [Alphaproteobacteria bacterium]
MRRRNIIAALVLLAFALVYGALTTQLPIRSLPDTPGPPFFPWINTAILLALSLGLLAQGIWAKTPDDGSPEATPDGATEATERWRAVWALGAFLAYLLVLPGLGFLLATIPFFAALMVLFGEKRWLWVAIGSIGISVALYVLFRHGFDVFLPRGVLPDLLATIIP